MDARNFYIMNMREISQKVSALAYDIYLMGVNEIETVFNSLYIGLAACVVLSLIVAFHIIPL